MRNSIVARIQQIKPENAQGQTAELFSAVRSKLGMVPNMMRAIGNSPASLQAYLQFSGSLATGLLSAKERELIALAVGQSNSCDYCLAAHSALGKMAGLTAEQIRDARLGNAVDSKNEALVRFSKKLVNERGQVSDDDLNTLRRFGFDDGHVAEIVANVAVNIFTNYFNHVAETDIDFPKAEVIQDHHEVCASIPGCDVTR
jgi:uncharacterized peroxidase-related enzyme